jgi:two-component sensor histidine kinase
MDTSPIKTNQFKGVIFLILFLGVLTNISISSLLIYLSAYQVLFSPILGTVIFITCYILVGKNKLKVKEAFLVTGYTVAAEVVIHTHYLGWESGFHYFFYALSVVFLLDFTWTVKPAIIFNSSMILLTVFTYLIYKNKAGAHYVDRDFLELINTFNLAVIGTLILIIMIYASHNNKIKDRALKAINKELIKQNKEIIEQRNHAEILLKEVHHRVKNNLQVISSLLSLQQNTIKDKKVLASLVDSKTRIEAIALIHQNLYNSNTGNQVDFKAYLMDLVASQKIVQSNINCAIHSEDLILELDTAIPLGLIVSEMMTNSMKHAFQGIELPKIEIKFEKKEDQYKFTFKDNGIGLPLNFTLTQPESLGMEIISSLIEQIEAKISFSSNNGAAFHISF